MNYDSAVCLKADNNSPFIYHCTRVQWAHPSDKAISRQECQMWCSLRRDLCDNIDHRGSNQWHFRQTNTVQGWYIIYLNAICDEMFALVSRQAIVILRDLWFIGIVENLFYREPFLDKELTSLHSITLFIYNLGYYLNILQKKVLILKNN